MHCFTEGFPFTVSELIDVEEVRACQHCSDLPLGPRPILQYGAAAPILLVGQAPGRLAHERGRPFADPSGVRLRSWLGVDEETFYDPDCFALLPMGFCYPGTGKGGDLPPRPECAPLWRARLLGGMQNVRLTVLIGQYALRWHLGEGGRGRVADIVSAWREHWPEVLPAPHPSPRNQRWLRNHPWFEGEVVPALQARVAELLGSRGNAS